MKKHISAYPKIIPELDYVGDEQTKVNSSSFKYRLISTFLHKRIEENNAIYLQKKLSGEKLYMPLFTMTKSLAHYNGWLKSIDEQELQKFLRVAETLIDTMDRDGAMWGWKHENKLQQPGYPPKRTSYSCLINGRGLGVLIRYYQFHPSDTLLQKIDGVLNTFRTMSDDGGVRGAEGHYLEYSWGDDSPVVWNGYMSAIVGLHDVAEHGPADVHEKAEELYNESLELLAQDQDKLFWEGKLLTWLTYDSNKLYFADGPYMKIETRQLEYLTEFNKRLNPALERARKIKTEYGNIAAKYEYLYFIQKKTMTLLKM